jgi:phospholipid/cholesterol/gamma-HCH transport system substrate-binding protein
MEVRASHLVAGALTLLVLCSVPALLFWSSGSAVPRQVNHFVRFSDSVAGLNVGSRVLFGGIPIGHVTAIGIDPQDSSLARVDISVDSTTPIYSDSKATLQLQGISGLLLVDISRGGRMRDQKLAPGAEIRSRYSSFGKLWVALREMAPKADMLMARISVLFNSANAAMANAILASVSKLRTHFAADSPALDSLRANADDAVAQFNQAKADFQQVSGNVDQLSTAAKALSQEIGNLTSSLSGAGANLGNFVAENHRPVEDFWSNGYSQWPTMIAGLHRAVTSLGRLWTEMKQDPARFFLTDRQEEGFQPPPPPSSTQHH